VGGIMLTPSVPSDPRSGFTLVEVVVAMSIILVGMLGLGAAGGGMIHSAIQLELEEVALQAVEDRLTKVSMDPRYEVLDSIYGGSEPDPDGLEGFTRHTSIVRTQETVSGGGTFDYQQVNVEISGPGLAEPVSRLTVLAAP